MMGGEQEPKQRGAELGPLQRRYKKVAGVLAAAAFFAHVAKPSEALAQNADLGGATGQSEVVSGVALDQYATDEQPKVVPKPAESTTPQQSTETIPETTSETTPEATPEAPVNPPAQNELTDPTTTPETTQAVPEPANETTEQIAPEPTIPETTIETTPETTPEQTAPETTEQSPEQQPPTDDLIGIEPEQEQTAPQETETQESDNSNSTENQTTVPETTTPETTSGQEKQSNPETTSTSSEQPEQPTANEESTTESTNSAQEQEETTQESETETTEQQSNNTQNQETQQSTEKKFSNPESKETLPDGAVYYNQLDEQWSEYPYHLPSVNPEAGKGNIGWNGCGPTTVAMTVASISGQEVDPTETADYMAKNGYLTEYGASTHAGLAATAEAWGMNSYQMANTHEAVKSVIEAGGMVIINGTDSRGVTPATEMGHIYAIRGINEAGGYLVADPLSKDKSLIAYKPESILGPSSMAIGVEQYPEEAAAEAEANPEIPTDSSQQNNREKQPDKDNEMVKPTKDKKKDQDGEEEEQNTPPGNGGGNNNSGNQPAPPENNSGGKKAPNAGEAPGEKNASSSNDESKSAKDTKSSGLDDLLSMVNSFNDDKDSSSGNAPEGNANVNTQTPENDANAGAETPESGTETTHNLDNLINVDGSQNNTGSQGEQSSESTPDTQPETETDHNLDELIGIGETEQNSGNQNQAKQSNQQTSQPSPERQPQPEPEPKPEPRPAPSESAPAPSTPTGQAQEYAGSAPEPEPQPQPEPTPEPEPQPEPQDETPYFKEAMVPDEYEYWIKKSAETYGLDPAILAAQIEQESGFNQNAVSYVGAKGPSQFMPYTWPGYAVDANGNGEANPFEIADAVMAQGDLMRENLDQVAHVPGEPYANALAAYNAGAGRVFQYNGVPPESFAQGQTYHYVENIMAGAEKYRE